MKSPLKFPVKFFGYVYDTKNEFWIVDADSRPIHKLTSLVSSTIFENGEEEPTEIKIGFCEGVRVFCKLKKEQGEMIALSFFKTCATKELYGKIVSTSL